MNNQELTQILKCELEDMYNTCCVEIGTRLSMNDISLLKQQIGVVNNYLADLETCFNGEPVEAFPYEETPTFINYHTTRPHAVPHHEKYYLVTEADLRNMLECEKMYNCLKAVGVDNWSGWDYKFDSDSDEDEDGEFDMDAYVEDMITGYLTYEPKNV